MIRIDDVSVALSGSPVLENISVKLTKGGLTALVGPNGAGKSTLLSAMARLVPLSSGRITVDRLDIAHADSSELARRLAIMPQDNVVAGRLRVGELVQFGRFPHHRGRPTAEDECAVRESLALFDLVGIQDSFIDTLSGGQRQRARAAMCYCQGTDFLLLDEPLNNLDIFYARELMRTLRDIADHAGRTIIIVLHDLNYAAAYADRIIGMRDGQIVADGPTQTIMQPDILQMIFGFEIEVKSLAGRPVSLHFL